MRFRLCALAIVAASWNCEAIKLNEAENDDIENMVLAQAEVDTTVDAEAEAEAQFIGKIIDALFGGKGEKNAYNQRAPNVNVVDNARVMIPEGADPTAVKLIIGDIMNNGIGGIKGAMSILKDLGGPGGWGTWNLPSSYQ